MYGKINQEEQVKEMKGRGIENTVSAHPELDTVKAWIAGLVEGNMGSADCPAILQGMEADFNWGEEMDSDPSRAFWLKLADGRSVMVSFS